MDKIARRIKQLNPLRKYLNPEIAIFQDGCKVSLDQKYIDTFKPINEAVSINSISQIKSFIKIIHHEDLIHGDLCFSNLGLDKNGKLLVFDWELLLSFIKNKSVVLRSSYLACHPSDLSNRELTKKSDLFAFANLIPQILLERYEGVKFCDKNQEKISEICMLTSNIDAIQNNVLDLLNIKL